MGKISYSAVVLDNASRTKLLQEFGSEIPEGWETIAHHMTINMGEINPDYEKFLGMTIPLRVTEIGKSDLAMAVKVSGFHSSNKIPHITLAVNRKEGGKPFLSNKITDAESISMKRFLL